MVRVGGGWDTLEHYLVTHDTGRFSMQSKFISGTDYVGKKPFKTPQRKFHQTRNRIPLRLKQS